MRLSISQTLINFVKTEIRLRTNKGRKLQRELVDIIITNMEEYEDNGRISLVLPYTQGLQEIITYFRGK